MENRRTQKHVMSAVGDLEPDAGAGALALDELGWVGVERDTAELAQFKAYLEKHNGLKGLDVVQPDEIERAKRVFYRDGFVVVRDALTPDQLSFLRQGVDRVVHEIAALDKSRTGNRGSHRYSFGGASLTGAQLHNPEWAMLIDLPTVTPILTAIFESSDYRLRSGGGDFCLPGAVDYQPLHSDTKDRTVYTSTDGTREFPVGSFLDPRGLMSLRDLPCPYVCANFLTVDFTALNGPTRQIPGTQNARVPIPTLEEEPEWMRLSTLCPAPAGAVVLRDVRAWHGGTPNLSNEVRSIPNAEFIAPWFHEQMRPSLPRAIHDGLSDHGKKISAHLVSDELKIGYRRNLGGTPGDSRAREPGDEA